MELERIRARLRALAGRVKNVRVEELEQVLGNHLGPRYPNYNHHGNPHHAFTVGTETFNIAKPHGKFVKAHYVTSFLEKMEALGLHEPEE